MKLLEYLCSNATHDAGMAVVEVQKRNGPAMELLVRVPVPVVVVGG